MAADFLGVSLSTLKRWREKGYFGYYKLSPRCYRYSDIELAEFQIKRLKGELLNHLNLTDDGVEVS